LHSCDVDTQDANVNSENNVIKVENLILHQNPYIIEDTADNLGSPKHIIKLRGSKKIKAGDVILENSREGALSGFTRTDNVKA
jgi:predicted transcriptional regulator